MGDKPQMTEAPEVLLGSDPRVRQSPLVWGVPLCLPSSTVPSPRFRTMTMLQSKSPW